MDICPKKIKTLIEKIDVFTAALFIIAKIWKQHKYPSVDEPIKMGYTHRHNELLLSHKK